MKIINFVKKDENLFHLILLAICTITIVLSFTFNKVARSFPLFFGTTCFILTLLQMVLDNRKNVSGFLKLLKTGALTPMDSYGQNSDDQGDEQATAKEQPVAWKTIFFIFALLAVYLVLIEAMHYLLASLLFLLFFLRFVGKVKWSTTLVFSFVFIGCLFVLFELLLAH